MSDDYKIDIAVLVIFFCRDDKLNKVFNVIKAVKPSKLYLYQDGPRNELDLPGIQECRRIVDDSNIDWNCKVQRFYQENNVGCDPSEYIAQKWLFTNEEMGIILEDDDVPSHSFFPFCKELLEKYKDDTRISLICGRNKQEETKNVKDSYFFSKIGGIWGWASWRRFFELWDEKYTWLDSPEKLMTIKKQLPKNTYKTFINTAKWHRDTGKEYYETIYAAAQWINEGYAIIPKENLIKNIGIGNETTHGTNEIRLLSKKNQRIFEMNAHEIDFPLIHPKELIRNTKYEKDIHTSSFEKLTSKIGYAFRLIKYKGVKAFFKKVTNISK